MSEPDRHLGLATMAMQNGNMVDEVIFVLAKVVAGQEIDAKDRQVLGRAETYLCDVKKGYHWVDNREIAPHTKASAFSFGAAASTWLEQAEPPTDFISNIEQMIHTIRQLLDEGNTDTSAIKKVQRFFDRVFQFSIQHLGSVGVRPDVPEII